MTLGFFMSCYLPGGPDQKYMQVTPNLRYGYGTRVRTLQGYHSESWCGRGAGAGDIRLVG